MTTLVAPPVDHLPAEWNGTTDGHRLPVDEPKRWASLADWRVTIRTDGRTWIERIYNDQHLYVIPNDSETTSSEWPLEWGTILDGWRFARSGVASDLTTAMVEAQSWTSVLD